MPAMLDDPTSPIIKRNVGGASVRGQLPPDVCPRTVTLRDRVTTATLIPFSSPHQVPKSLIQYLCDQLNREIELGDTYPMIAPLPVDLFGPYWFANFGAVMLLGEIESAAGVQELARSGADWEKYCLGSFYIKPNYPGRSSHVCNGGFIVTPAARNKGVGRLMGEGYIVWAPKLGYTYSVFNLVYETNVASCRIWDALGFKRIGRVKGCGNLKSYPDEYVDAIIYGRDLGQDEDTVSEERFDKIKFYLKHGKYPNGADRAEKSRLRSAATHYKLIQATDTEPERLMLKDKEVISDPQRQYEIARSIHMRSHGGINKSTAAIAEKYHWVRIKETVSVVIKNCGECSEASKAMARPEITKRTHSFTAIPYTDITTSPTAAPQQTPLPVGQPIYGSPGQLVSTSDRDQSLAAVRHYNASSMSSAPIASLDPRLAQSSSQQMQRQAAQPPVAMAPSPSILSTPKATSSPAQHRSQQKPSSSLREPRERSSSPSAQLLQEQQRIPDHPNSLRITQSTLSTPRRSPATKGRAIDDSPATTRESRRKRTKR